MLDGLLAIAVAEGIGVVFAPLPHPLLCLYETRPGEVQMVFLHENTLKNQIFYAASKLSN